MKSVFDFVRVAFLFPRLPRKVITVQPCILGGSNCFRYTYNATKGEGQATVYGVPSAPFRAGFMLSW